MNSALKKIILIGGGLCAVGAASVGGLRFWLGKSLSKESLVSQMEKAWNCRAQIDDVKLVLAASPARLEITGCRIWLRDEEVGKPLGQRTAREPGPISIETAVLEVKLEDLISKRLNVQQLTLSDVSVREEVDKEGNSSLGQNRRRPRWLPQPPPRVPHLRSWSLRSLPPRPKSHRLPIWRLCRRPKRLRPRFRPPSSVLRSGWIEPAFSVRCSSSTTERTPPRPHLRI